MIFSTKNSIWRYGTLSVLGTDCLQVESKSLGGITSSRFRLPWRQRLGPIFEKAAQHSPDFGSTFQKEPKKTAISRNISIYTNKSTMNNIDNNQSEAAPKKIDKPRQSPLVTLFAWLCLILGSLGGSYLVQACGCTDENRQKIHRPHQDDRTETVSLSYR